MPDVPRTEEPAPKERDERGHYIVPKGERIATLSADGRSVDIWWINEGGVTYLAAIPLRDLPSESLRASIPAGEPPPKDQK